jgi:hypothetical protein
MDTPGALFFLVVWRETFWRKPIMAAARVSSTGKKRKAGPRGGREPHLGRVPARVREGLRPGDAATVSVAQPSEMRRES